MATLRYPVAAVKDKVVLKIAFSTWPGLASHRRGEAKGWHFWRDLTGESISAWPGGVDASWPHAGRILHGGGPGHDVGQRGALG